MDIAYKYARRTFCAALLICVATIGQTGAKADTTGKTLLDLCSAPHVGNNAMYFACLTYINGFRDGYRSRDEQFCFPENLTNGEMAAAYVRVLRSAEARSGPGPLAQTPSAEAFTATMMAAYPCKPSR
jgi:hypothetical protein